MKKFAIPLICILGALVFLGQAPLLEGKFTVRVDQWQGLFSDEFYHPNPNTAIDMMDFEIKQEGGRSFLEQRAGWIRVYPKTPAGVASIRSIFISQITGDSERIVVSMSDGKFYTCGGSTEQWYELSSGTGNTEANTNMTLFKDTIIATGAGQCRLFTKRNSATGGLFQVAEQAGMLYEQTLLHQDRIYGYGIDADSTSSKLVWWPEFALPLNGASAYAYMNPDTTNGAGFIYIDKDNGDFLTNAVTHQGHIIAFKSGSTYKVMISPSTNAPNEVVKISGSIGAYGYGAVTEHNGILYVLGDDGVYSFDGVSFTKISDPINYWFRDSVVASTGQAQVFKTAVAVGNKLFVSLPTRTSQSVTATVLDSRTFVYDINLGVWYKFDFNGANTCSGNESHYLLRYEYSPACVWGLLGGSGGSTVKYLGQRLIFTLDSSANGNDNICMYPEGWRNSLSGSAGAAGDSINAYFDGAFFASGNLMTRRQFERMIVYGRSGTLDTIAVDIYSDRQTGIVDTAYFPLQTTPTLANRRLDDLSTGSLLRYRIRTRGGAPKINFIELVGHEKGMADETE